jgi:amidophosphoribosyltransferase
MCGIAAVIAKEDGVSFDLYNLLLNLQHRGQDAAGIVVMDSTVHALRRQGLVSNVFDREAILSLKGAYGIGHVRYPTTRSKRDPQPLYSDFSGAAMAHNGHVINEGEIREALKGKGIFCDTDVDLEPVLKTFSYLYFKGRSAEPRDRGFHAIRELMDIVQGAYSVVTSLRSAGLLVFRDPLGIRPLVWGRKNGSFAFASESISLRKIGYDDIEDVLPGEAIFVDRSLEVIRERIRECPQRSCMFEWVYFSRAPSYIEGVKVNQVRGRLGEELSRQYMASPFYGKFKGDDRVVVAPVPETARPAAKIFSEVTNHTYKDVIEKNRYAGRFFIRPTQELRENVTQMSIETFPEAVKDKIVLLVDDSVVRGTTSKRIVSLVREAGAAEVHLFSTCPPLKHPCRYGIDIPTSDELIASTKDTDEIRDYIGADSLWYQTLDGLTRAIGKPLGSLCTACLTGDYPTHTAPRPVNLDPSP